MAFSVSAFSESPFGAEALAGLVLDADGSSTGSASVSGSILEVANPTGTISVTGTVSTVSAVDISNIVSESATGTGATAGAIVEVANVASNVTGTADVTPTLAFEVANPTANATGTATLNGIARDIANPTGTIAGVATVPNVNTTLYLRNLSIDATGNVANTLAFAIANYTNLSITSVASVSGVIGAIRPVTGSINGTAETQAFEYQMLRFDPNLYVRSRSVYVDRELARSVLVEADKPRITYTDTELSRTILVEADKPRVAYVDAELSRRIKVAA